MKSVRPYLRRSDGISIIQSPSDDELRPTLISVLKFSSMGSEETSRLLTWKAQIEGQR